MRMLILCLFCLTVPRFIWAQDERFFRKIFSGEFVKEVEVEQAKKYSYTFHTPEYLIDLNNDGKPESLVFVKRDSEDWIDILNSFKEKIYSYRFETKGFNSGLYRVVKKELDSNTTVLVLFYFEGATEYINFESSARVYLLTVDHKSLKTISVTKGPSIYEEVKTYKGHFHLRNYQVSVVDLAYSGRKQLYIKFRDMSHVLTYKGDGVWAPISY